MSNESNPSIAELKAAMNMQQEVNDHQKGLIIKMDSLLSQLREELAQRDAEVERLKATKDELHRLHCDAAAVLSERIAALESQQAASVGGEREVCDTCHGQGEIYSGEDQHFDYFSFQPPEPVMITCPECNGESSAFKREDRYIVIKRKDLEAAPIYLQVELSLALEKLAEHLPGRECLVIESDWPEYPIAWQMIEARMTGATLSPAGGGVVSAPEGFALVPQEIHLSAAEIELINGMCGDGNEDGGYGPYQDGTLYIGYAQQDDGSKIYGLHISCDECPEEGVTTLAEFAKPQANSQEGSK